MSLAKKLLTEGQGIYRPAPALIRCGQLTHDEFFITEKAAKEGVRITNTSATEPIVMLKHSAEDPELVVE